MKCVGTFSFGDLTSIINILDTVRITYSALQGIFEIDLSEAALREKLNSPLEEDEVSSRIDSELTEEEIKIFSQMIESCSYTKVIDNTLYLILTDDEILPNTNSEAVFVIHKKDNTYTIADSTHFNTSLLKSNMLKLSKIDNLQLKKINGTINTLEKLDNISEETQDILDSLYFKRRFLMSKPSRNIPEPGIPPRDQVSEQAKENLYYVVESFIFDYIDKEGHVKISCKDLDLNHDRPRYQKARLYSIRLGYRNLAGFTVNYLGLKYIKSNEKITEKGKRSLDTLLKHIAEVCKASGYSDNAILLDFRTAEGRRLYHRIRRAASVKGCYGDVTTYLEKLGYKRLTVKEIDSKDYNKLSENVCLQISSYLR